ncbi:hypothetical protein Tco_1379924 [Tanacetum coccineum]
MRFKGITGVCVPRSLSWRENLDRVENVDFDQVRCYLCPSSIEWDTEKSVGLRVANSHTVMLPQSNQAIYDALDRFSGLYIHSFSLANLILPLLKLFCDVLKYFRVYLSRLNPYGYAKFITFAIMYKAYGDEPSIDLFRGFFNLYSGGEWLTFAKRPKADVPTILKKWDKRSFKDKIHLSISETLMYQHVARHPANVQSFPDPILFLAGLKMSWKHTSKRLAIFVGENEMVFRNFMFSKDDKEMTFLPHEPSPGFDCGSPFSSIKNEPTLLEGELLDSANSEQLVDNTTDSGCLSDREEMPIIGSGNVAERINDRKCKTKGSKKPFVKRKPVHVGSSSRSTHQKSSPAKAESSSFLTISNDEEGICCFLVSCSNSSLYLPLLSYLVSQAFLMHPNSAVDCHLMMSNVTLSAWKGHLMMSNVTNQRAQELLKVADQVKGECEVFKEREKARDKEYEELRLKCEAAMADFDNNIAFNVISQKIKSLSDDVKEH